MNTLPLQPQRDAVPGMLLRIAYEACGAHWFPPRTAQRRAVSLRRSPAFVVTRRAWNAISLLDPALPKSVPPYLAGLPRGIQGCRNSWKRH
jgi:hypothetical protein